LEFSSSGSGSSEDCTSVTPGVAVDKLNCVLESVGSHADKHRAEDLLFIASHVGCDIVDDGWGYKIALWELWVLVIATIKNYLSSFSWGSFDNLDYSIFQLFICNWGKIDSFILACANFEALSLSSQLINPFVGLSYKYGSGEGHASLSTGTECGIS